MKKSWLIVFAVVLLADLIAVFLKNETLVYIAKPLVIITLIIYFLAATARIKNRSKKFVAGALAFSWLGDVLLMFESSDKSFFLFGLTAFLIAHLFYIFFFSITRTDEKIKLKGGWAVVVTVYFAGLIFLLFNDLGEMKIPVIVYGVVISAMFLMALHMLYIKNNEAGKLMMLGALLFVASDSLLAINKFYQPFQLAGIFTMFTYGSAQLFITLGAARFILSISKQ
jgi:uncharacterized membrane protein YhhN